MNSNLLFDFSVNKENKTIHVTREFNANLELVWQTWTTAELLDKWWAPHPFSILTKSFDFSEGGMWHYAMVSPENEKQWCRVDYETVNVMKNFTALDAFCDEAGNINTAFSRMHWNNGFEQTGENTTVTIVITMDTLETLEKIMAMGFKEGFTMGLQQLENLLRTLK
jgi:uncharacterized protein YndB with AHSA1/START domain